MPVYGIDTFEDEGYIEKKSEYSREDVSPLFDRLFEEAQYKFGKEYSGTIAEHDNFNMCGVMPKEKYDEAKGWWFSELYKGSTPEKAPDFIKDDGLENGWREAMGWHYEKNVCAVVIPDETRNSKVLVRFFGVSESRNVGDIRRIH